jgi:hypothetical protein
MNTYAQICLQIYIYLYLCFLIIGKFESPVWVAEIGCYMRFIAYSITKIMFHILTPLFFLL